MKLYNRFALLAVLAAVFGSALVMGCGGSSDEDNATADGNAMASPSGSPAKDPDTTP